ncbi:sporulation protein YlmC with PRC-barrel domain [Rhodoblastus sphagnicola]|nr:PRC-barrel domain-containing protein [Rhodoblastus sphagnicola]MBB4198921.1 sporulation protein YlmC with PRC-barrel domain [Rhodoblastus sphagnicola]
MNTKAILGACALLSVAALSTAVFAEPKLTAGETNVLTSQGASDVLASTIVGATVYSPRDEKVGDIQYLVMNKDGKIEGAVIGVGGFLGVAKKDVALNFKALTISYDTDNSVKKITADVTKDGLKSAPDYLFLKKS